MRAMSKRLPEFQDCATAEKERLTGGDYCSGRNLVCYASGTTGGIAVKNLETGELKLVTAGGRGECSPAFSPDGASMLFLSVIPGSGRQVFRYQFDSGELQQVTKIRGAAMEPDSTARAVSREDSRDRGLLVFMERPHFVGIASGQDDEHLAGEIEQPHAQAGEDL